MTQDILSSLDSDEVNSVSDTIESLQVARLIRTKFYDIINRSGTAEHKQLIQLTPSNDSTTPVLMHVPNGVKHIDWIKYFNEDDHAGYSWVTILPNDQFLDCISKFDTTQSNIGSFTYRDPLNGSPQDYAFYYQNDIQPRFCTVLSNTVVVFDAFDNTLDTTLQATKSMCMGSVYPNFLMEDTFVPDLPDEQFPLLLNEAKALAFYELKQMPHAKAEQEIKRQWSSVAKNKNVDKPEYFNQLPDFGKSNGRYARMSFRSR